MNSLDVQVIQHALKWLEQGHGIWLCTVLSTFGSAPRGPGAMLVVLEQGSFCGSLSGGCVEEDFLERLGRREFEPRNQIIRYGEGGFAPNLKLPCGGVLDVLVEYFEPCAPSKEHFSAVQCAIQGREVIVREVTRGSDQVRIEKTWVWIVQW